MKDRPKDSIPLDLPVTDVVVHDAGKHTLYAGTSGVGSDHVWWFDGTKRWLPAGIRIDQVRDGKTVKVPVDSPVHALVVDPEHLEVVYAGTDVGVFKGVGTFPATGDPAWVWTQFSNALPEAACIDLVDPSDAPPAPCGAARPGLVGGRPGRRPTEPMAYLRAHDFNTRRGPVPVGALDPLGDPATPTTLRLDASPDVRVHRAPGTKAPRPFTFFSQTCSSTPGCSRRRSGRVVTRSRSTGSGSPG